MSLSMQFPPSQQFNGTNAYNPPPAQANVGVKSRAPALLACTECRTRHLKCDAGQPVCGRCITDQRECRYVQSRRGYKGPRKRPFSFAFDIPTGERIDQLEQFRGLPQASAQNFQDPSTVAPQDPLLTTPSIPFAAPLSRRQSDSNLGQRIQFPSPPETIRSDTIRSDNCDSSSFIEPPSNSLDFPRNILFSDRHGADARHLTNLYYVHFHDGHPILLPRKYFPRHNRYWQYPNHLEVIMQFIGSHYDEAAPTAEYRNLANQVLSDQIPNDGYKVQALLLFAISLHARDEQKLAKEILGTAVDLALALGMNRKEFCIDHGEGCRSLQESWRRTWWELYVMDGMLAALHQLNTFKLVNVETNVPLPCEEATYQSAVCKMIPEPHPMSLFQGRVFASHEVAFSSFAYRIEAIRLLGTILAVGQLARAEDNDRVEAIDASMTSWLLNLPYSKREVVDQDGKIDEMLFQAHMIINAGSIYLHRPRSDLVFAPIEEKTACTRPENYTTPITAHHIHSTKAILAANKLSNLISLPVVLTKHSPFFTCAITLSAIVHLSASSIPMYSDRSQVMRERVLLATGALKGLSVIWAVAGSVLNQVKEVARGVVAFDPGNLSTQVFAEEVNAGAGIDVEQRFLQDAMGTRLPDEGFFDFV